MDSDTIGMTGFIAIVLLLIAGTGWLISRDQDAEQERALACIAAGHQFVSGDCVAGPSAP